MTLTSQEYLSLEFLGYPEHRIWKDGTVERFWPGLGRGERKGWVAQKISVHHTGYPVVTLRRNQRGRQFFLHRLLLLAFIGPCPDGMEACHDNGIRSDYRLENLRWGTKLENAADRIRHGNAPRGENHYEAILTDESVRQMRSLHAKGISMGQLGRLFGVRTQTASYAVRGKTWKHI